MPKIIVGVEESDRSKDAIELALRFAVAADAELLLVGAYPYDTSPSRSLNAEYQRYLREDAEGILARARADIGDAVSVSTLAIAEVSPAKALQSIAEREKAALIVLGSSSRSQAGRVLAGTTAERLLHGAPCPVAVAPMGYRASEEAPIFTITVGYDGTAEAEAALDAALSIAVFAGVRMRVVEVVDVMWTGMPAMTSGPGYNAPPKQREAAALERLRDRVSSLGAGVEVEPVVVCGEAEERLTQQTSDTDLMVVGSRGYGPHRAVLLGSVSGRLVRDARCPVLVVPRGIESPLLELFAEKRAEAV